MFQLFLKKVLREFGLALFLLGAGFEGGVALVEQIREFGGAIVAWGFAGGAVMTIVPMVVAFVMAKYTITAIKEMLEKKLSHNFPRVHISSILLFYYNTYILQIQPFHKKRSQKKSFFLQKTYILI